MDLNDFSAQVIDTALEIMQTQDPTLHAQITSVTDLSTCPELQESLVSFIETNLLSISAQLQLKY